MTSAGSIHRQSGPSNVSHNATARESPRLACSMLVVYEEGGAPATARSERYCHSAAVTNTGERHDELGDASRSEPQEEEERCPICLESVMEGGGRMPCCSKLLHKACAVAWRRSNLTPTHIGRAGKKKDPDTRKCVWCSALGNGNGSSRRMFGSCELAEL